MICDIGDCNKKATYKLEIEVYVFGIMDFYYCDEHTKENEGNEYCSGKEILQEG